MKMKLLLSELGQTLIYGILFLFIVAGFYYVLQQITQFYESKNNMKISFEKLYKKSKAESYINKNRVILDKRKVENGEFIRRTW